MRKRLACTFNAPTRVTLKMIADEVGTSICTVNRALTGRPRVSAEMRERVQAVASHLGYRPNRLARSLSRPVLRLALLCPADWPAHYRRLMNGARERLAELSDLRVEVDAIEVKGMRRGTRFLQALHTCAAKDMDGFVIALGDYPMGDRQLIWEALGSRHTPFVLLGRVGDESSPELTVVEQDSRVCGRISAELIALMSMAGTETAVIVGRQDIRDHRLKIAAFTEEATRRGLRPPHVVETQDDPAHARPPTEQLLQAHPNIGALYVATENLQGVLDGVAARGLAGKLKIVTTGVAETALTALKAGLIHATLDQNEPLQGRLAVDALFTYLETGRRPAPELLVPPVVVLQSNAEAQGNT